MDNRQQIERHQRFSHVFTIVNLACCKLVALKENTITHSFFKVTTVYYSKWTKHTQGDQDLP